LVERRVDVGPESLEFDARRAGERSDRSVRWHELALPKRRQLSNGHAVSRHYEGLTTIERPHDLAALVAQLALCDPPRH
jgi:hypothetical protein